MAILCAVKSNATAFANDERLVKYLIRLLRSKHASDLVEGVTPNLHEFICHVVVEILRPSIEWMDDSVKVFLDDSLASRVWVDKPQCQVFVQNVLTVGSPVPTPGEVPDGVLPLVRHRFADNKARKALLQVVYGHESRHST